MYVSYVFSVYKATFLNFIYAHNVSDAHLKSGGFFGALSNRESVIEELDGPSKNVAWEFPTAIMLNAHLGRTQQGNGLKFKGARYLSDLFF